MITSPVSAMPSTTVVPVAQSVLPPGYGVMWQNNTWFPCRIRHEMPSFIAGPPLNNALWLHHYPDITDAVNFCVAEAALEQYEFQPLRNMEQYPDRIEAMEHWLFEKIGRYPCWWLHGADSICAGIYLDNEVFPAIFAYGDSLCEALITLCSMIEQQQREADLLAWETWWHESASTR